MYGIKHFCIKPYNINVVAYKTTSYNKAYNTQQLISEIYTV